MWSLPTCAVCNPFNLPLNYFELMDECVGLTTKQVTLSLSIINLLGYLLRRQLFIYIKYFAIRIEILSRIILKRLVGTCEVPVNLSWFKVFSKFLSY
jgi:hypothetical protein